MIRTMLASAVAAIGPPASIDTTKSLELVNAAPSDFRAILAAMIVLLFVQTVERWWAGFRAGKTAEKFAGAAEKLTEAITTLGGAHAIHTLQMQTKIGEQVTEIRTLTAEVRRLKP